MIHSSQQMMIYEQVYIGMPTVLYRIILELNLNLGKHDLIEYHDLIKQFRFKF